jgi:hypothetical protein
MDQAAPVELSRAAERRSRVLTLARTGFVLVITGAVVFGLIGMHDYANRPAYDGGHGWLDLIYYTLQLFVLGSAPLDSGGALPWTLQVARFLAPAATVYALFEAGRTVFLRQWRAWRQRHLHGHAIVIGDTPIAQAITKDLRRKGTAVISLSEHSGPALAGAGVAGARVVYAAVDDSADGAVNVLTAAAVVASERRRGTAPIKVYAMVSDPAFALGVRARRIGRVAGGAALVDFFSVDELAARELVRQDATLFQPGSPARIVVAGLSVFGRALVSELARAWSLSPRRDERLVVTLIDPHADQVGAELRDRWAAIADRCELRPINAALSDTAWQQVDGSPHRVYLCQSDEYEAMRSALTVTDMWRVPEGALVLRVDRLGPIADAFSDHAGALLDDIADSLRIISPSRLLYDGTDVTKLISEDLIELLAQAIHRRYLTGRLDSGQAMGSEPAMRPWPDLEEQYRDANRAQARDIQAKLARLGCTIGPRGGRAAGIDPAMVELLAIDEHERWMANRKSNGWTYGPQRNEETRQHPSMVDWAMLSESERDKDRSAIVGIPSVLADAGLQIVRLRAGVQDSGAVQPSQAG